MSIGFWLRYHRIGNRIYRVLQLSCLGVAALSLAYVSMDTRVIAREMIIANNMRAAQLTDEFNMEELKLQVQENTRARQAVQCRIDLLTAASRMGWNQAYRFVRQGYLTGECS
jgi:hypothetical protein